MPKKPDPNSVLMNSVLSRRYVIFCVASPFAVNFNQTSRPKKACYYSLRIKLFPENFTGERRLIFCCEYEEQEQEQKLTFRWMFEMVNSIRMVEEMICARWQAKEDA
jgi:hypothetical protein